MIYLDTHVLVWLYSKGSHAVPTVAAQLIEETDDIRISPMVRLELQYLFEMNRVTVPAAEVLDELIVQIGLQICEIPFLKIIKKAEQQNWTRDPFDRLIVAQAAIKDAVLISKDASIHDHYEFAVWDKAIVTLTTHR